VATASVTLAATSSATLLATAEGRAMCEPFKISCEILNHQPLGSRPTWNASARQLGRCRFQTYRPLGETCSMTMGDKHHAQVNSDRTPISAAGAHVLRPPYAMPRPHPLPPLGSFPAPNACGEQGPQAFLVKAKLGRVNPVNTVKTLVNWYLSPATPSGPGAFVLALPIGTCHGHWEAPYGMPSSGGPARRRRHVARRS
jgi:hypothetical protein